MEIRIKIGERVFEGELNDTETAQKVAAELPVSSSGNFWGDEIYFPIPLELDNEHPQREVEVGDLAYGPSSRSFCIFYGRTPSSNNDKPAPASPVTVIGTIAADPEELRELSSGDIQDIEVEAG